MIETAVIDAGPLVKAEALAWPDQAKALKVDTPAAYEQAGEMLKGIKALRGRIGETFDPHIKRAFEAHRALTAEKKQAEAPLLEAETILKGGLSAFDQEQERLRVAEERRLQEIARQQEEQRRLEEAASLEREASETGDESLRAVANDVLAAPVYVPAPVVAKATPKVAGLSHRDNWSARVTSLIALVKFVAANPQHVNLLLANAAALNQLARAMKQNLRIDGVQAVNTPNVAVRR